MSRVKKEAYAEKFKQLLEEYPTIFIVNVDNVGSSQMHEIRKSLRGTAVILMGKNTMMRRVLRTLRDVNPAYEKLVGVVKGNIGLVFTNGDLKEVREKILENRVQAPAKAGAVAPVDVTIPAGNTGMEPGKTSFFQALGIPTKIARGTIGVFLNLVFGVCFGRIGRLKRAKNSISTPQKSSTTSPSSSRATKSVLPKLLSLTC